MLHTSLSLYTCSSTRAYSFIFRRKCSVSVTDWVQSHRKAFHTRIVIYCFEPLPSSRQEELDRKGLCSFPSLAKWGLDPGRLRNGLSVQTCSLPHPEEGLKTGGSVHSPHPWGSVAIPCLTQSTGLEAGLLIGTMFLQRAPGLWQDFTALGKHFTPAHVLPYKMVVNLEGC